MKVLRQANHLLGHKPSDRELAGLHALDEIQFDAVRAKHLAKQPRPESPDGAGIPFILSLIGAPTCLLLSFFESEPQLLWASIFLLAIGLMLFMYLSSCARYWREHRAIRIEEVRRYGRTSFG